MTLPPGAVGCSAVCDCGIPGHTHLLFVPGNSTVNQLVDIYNTFPKSLDNGLEV